MIFNVEYTNEKGDICKRIISPAPYEINKMTKRFLPVFIDDEDICKHLDNILKDMDCTIISSIGKLTSVNTLKYDTFLSVYQYYWEQLFDDNNKTEYLDKIRQRYIKDIEFDCVYYATLEKDKKPNKKTTKKKNKTPLWIREESTDLFDNSITYIYTNTKTGEIIQSKNPSLKETLKDEKIKKKNSTKKIINISNLSFNFNKK